MLTPDVAIGQSDEWTLPRPLAGAPWLRFAIPIALILLAVASIGVVAFGLRPSTADYTNGLRIIVFVRKVQWLLVGVSLISSMTLLTLVIGNKLALGWLSGLVAVLMLFLARFVASGDYALPIYDLPQFIDAAHPNAPQPNEWIVGVVFEGQAYAFPYRALHTTPMVVVTDYSKRMLLMWSEGANRCVATAITRDLRPRSLEVVSKPKHGLLIYEKRYGQFISSITGKTIDDTVPYGFGSTIPVTKTIWANWRASYPETRVMLAAGDASRAPWGPLSLTDDGVALVCVHPPVALESEIPLNQTLNLAHGDLRLLVFRDPHTGVLRAFDRRVQHDLFPLFNARTDRQRHPGATLVDSDTQSLWSSAGRAIDGPLKGDQLREIPIEDNLNRAAMEFWYPNLHFHN